jgi:protease-4
MQNNLIALIYLKNKVHKLRNFVYLLSFLCIFLLSKLIFFDGNSVAIDSDHIASIKIEGEIFEDDYRSKILREISLNNHTKAVLAIINSPGGGIVGSEILYNDLKSIANKKPLVILIESVGASGAYMVSLASDYIIAYNGSITGSVGVLMQSYEITNLANKLGITFNSYKSSPLKGSPSLFEKSSPQVNSVVDASIADSQQFFCDLVKQRRGKKITTNNVCDGRIFTGRQALKAGLIDSIGGKEEVAKFLFSKKIDITKIPIKEIEIIKEEHNFFKQFLNKIPLLQQLNINIAKPQIMANTSFSTIK